MEMFVEFKHGNSSDPFGDGDAFSPKLTNVACTSRGQITLYSIRQRAYQFRTSTLTVGIFGKVARLFRWDNTGCSVTKPIDYSTTEGNRHLAGFFRRLNQMVNEPEARGWDPTVTDATQSEIRDFAEAVKVACVGQSGPQQKAHGRKKEAGGEEEVVDPMFRWLAKSIGDSEKYLRRKVFILDAGIKKGYIVGYPTSVLKAPTGRTTRGFVAMSVQTKKLVFLKDTWRPDFDGFQPENHWYNILQERGETAMKNIGASSYGSDVYATKEFVKCKDKKQRMITHLYAKDLGRVEAMVGYIHHRVVFSELYLPLETFRDSKHLTTIMCGIAEGMFP